LLKSQKRWSIMMCCWSMYSSRQFNQLIYYDEFSGVAKRVLWHVKLKQKPPRWLVPATHHPSKKRRPMLIQIPHCQLSGFEQGSSPLNRMYAFLLVRTNASYVILSNGFSTSGSHRLLALSYGDRNCLVLRFLAPNPTKEFQATRYTSSPINKSKFKHAIKHASDSRWQFC
jgi:hypothetical protein